MLVFEISGVAPSSNTQCRRRVTKRLEKGEKARDLASVFKEMCIVVEEDEERGDDEGVNLEKELEKVRECEERTASFARLVSLSSMCKAQRHLGNLLVLNGRHN